MDRIGPYEVLEELGRGGAGVVFRARDARLRREVAIKLLLRGRGATEKQRQRFEREGRALASLDHPNVIRVQSVGDHRGQPYLVMDMIQGESLQVRLDREGPLPAQRAAQLCAKVARALEHAHGQSILHRDVKPDNVLLNDQGEPLLTDFGLARNLDPSVSASLSVQGRLLGTPGFWAPEQARGDIDRYGPHTDVYGLGATFYALLTGMPPVSGGSLFELLDATLSQDRSPPSSLRPELPKAVDEVCLRCLAVEPADRYTSAAVLAEDLECLAEGKELPDRALRRRAPRVSLGRRSLLGAVVLGGGGLLVGAVGAAALGFQLSGARVELRQTRQELEETVAAQQADTSRIGELEETVAAQQADMSRIGELESDLAKVTQERDNVGEAVDRWYPQAKYEHQRYLQSLVRLARSDATIPARQRALAEERLGAARSALALPEPTKEDFERLVTLLESARDANPRSTEAWFSLAERRLYSGDFGLGAVDLAWILELDPAGFAERLSRLDDRHALEGDDDGQDALQFVSELGADLYFTLVERSFDRRQDLVGRNRVIEGVDEWAKDWPDLTAGHFLRGNARVGLQLRSPLERAELLDGIEAFDRCLELNPQHATARLHRGYLWSVLIGLEGEGASAAGDRALDDYATAAEHEPFFLATALYLQAEAHVRLAVHARLERGIAHLQRAVELLQQAVSQGYPSRGVARNPVFEPLLERPEVIELLSGR